MVENSGCGGCSECEKHGIKFDFERLKEAVESETIEYTLPPNSSKEEIRNFIINSARGL